MTPSKNKRKSTPEDSDEGEEVNLSDEEGGLRVDGIYIPPPPKPYCSVENKGPRLLITRITNKFFKSYAGTQVLGPFHKCFNAIVGPNGSGKSNVIDSMLFVFGFRASKIRSKKISVLLHNSEQYRNVQSCTVSVHFALIVDKEGDNYDVVPNSEFVVSRTAHKDNSSYYTLDGKKTQFKDIGILLKKHGIDLDHNRFLILQGEVEQISLMAPKGNENEPGMLEYLEDIIGTTRYKLPLSQLAVREEQLSEQRSEKLNRLKLVQNELDELKAPMEEAVGFLKLENNIVTKRNLLYQKQIVVLEEGSKSLEESQNDVDQNLQALVEKLNTLKEAKNTRVTILKEASKKRESLVKRKDALNEAFDKANNKDIQLVADMQQTNKTRKKTKELLAEERRKLEQYEQTPEDTAKQIAECEKVTERMTTKKEGLEEDKIKVLANLRNQTKDLQEKKEAIQTRLVKLNKVVDETKSAFTLAESELKLYMSNQENETTKFENMRNTYETSETKITQHSNEIQKLKTQIPNRERKLKDSNEQLLAIRNEEINVVNELRRKRGMLEESRSSLQASKSKGKVLDALMQQKREGKCPGLFGRLGDLGAIDEKYDVAVSTACGALDNIVVDTVNTAQWCIEFLKKHDIGRATIIALEKQEHLRRYYESRIVTPENVPRLFDLIRIEDDRVRPAFYYGLHDTLVANNLDQGSRIAYGAQRYRVVTLGGDLIETTGTMSGGGRQVSRGRMGQSVRTTNVNPKDLEKLETDVQTLEQKLREFRERQTTLENELNNLTPELRQMKVALEKYTIELQSLKQQQPALAKQLKIQEAKMKSIKVDPVQMKKLTDIVNQKKVSYDEAAANSSVLQKEVDLLTKEIKEKTQGKVQTLDKSLREVNQTIEKCKSEVTRLTVGLKTAKRNAIKSKEKIATMEQDITNAENNMMGMKAEREEIESDAKKLLTCIEEIAAAVTEAEEEEGVVKKEVEVMTKKENKLKAEKIEIDQKAKTVKEKVDEMKSKIHHWRLKITQLKYQEIPKEPMPELKTYTNEELDNIEQQTVQRQLQALEEEIKSAKPNVNAIVEFRKKQNVYIGRMQELEEVSQQRNKMRGYYENLHQRRKDEFLTGYNIIKMKLKEMYQMITLGGDADFEMLDTFDPFNEGIQFRVRPPKKTWKLITNLSGGEKTLSSLALVFALHYYKPSPLYVMDEIDAALDFKNVSIVGNYIKDRTKNAQFIIISLRSNMFELCDYLIGIYKTLNCTKSVCIDPRKYDNKPENERRAEAAPSSDKRNENAATPNQRSTTPNNQNQNDVTSPTNISKTNTINENCVSTQRISNDPRNAKEKVVSPNNRNVVTNNNENSAAQTATGSSKENSVLSSSSQNILNDPRAETADSMMDVSNDIQSETEVSLPNASREVIPESSMEEGMESMEVDD